MKKIISVLLTLVMLFAITSVCVCAAETTMTTLSVADARTYEAYQIFVGDVEGKTLSNVKWGANGTGVADTPVDEATLALLAGLTNTDISDESKLAVIESLVNLNTAPVGTVSKDAPLSVATGYYLMKDVSDNLEEGQELSAFVVKVVGDVVITPKVGEVTSKKKIKDVNDSLDDPTVVKAWQDSADYDIGDEIPYLLEGVVTEKYAAYDEYYFCFHDTLTKGLDFKADSVHVFVDGVEITEGFKLIKADGDKYIKFEFENLKNIPEVKAGSVITAEYLAVLNTDAIIGSLGNPNVMYLEYSNDPNGDGHGETPEDKVTVFTYKLVVNKVDGESGEALKGAGFTLYKKDAVAGFVAVGPEVGGEELSTFTWTGLDDGIYKLSETTTPAGYNTMADIEFTVTADHEIESADPQLTSLSGNLATGELTSGTITKDIENNKGTILPETGAEGTIAFITIGAILAAIAVVFLITRKKMSVYED